MHDDDVCVCNVLNKELNACMDKVRNARLAFLEKLYHDMIIIM